MPELKIAVQLASLSLPFKKALLAAAQMGVSAVEIDARGEVKPQDFSATGLRQLKKMLEDLNLRVAAVSFRTRRGYNVPHELEARVEATKAAMKFARQLGASVLVNQIGRVPAEPSGPDWQLLVDVLSDLGHYGQHVGAFVAAETGSESGPDLARLIAAIPPGSMGVTLDPGNLLVNGFSPLEAARVLGENVLHVHAKDGVRDLAQGRGVEVPLGRGSADFPSLLGALEEHEYRGYFSIEREGADDPLHEIGQAVQYLRSL